MIVCNGGAVKLCEYGDYLSLFEFKAILDHSNCTSDFSVIMCVFLQVCKLFGLGN